MPKILILRFSSIGDIVLTSPIIRCLKEQVENVEIHYLTKKGFSALLSSNPHITKVFGIQKKVNEVLPELKKEQYDYVVDLHNNIRTKQVIWALNKPHKSFPKLNFKKWMLVKLKVNSMPPIHIVDRYFKAVSYFKIENDLKGLDFYIPEKDEIDVSQFPIKLNQGYIALVIGAQHYTKRMPNQKLIELCKQISLPIILVGGKDDITNGSIIEKGVGKNVYNTCGKYNLFESASIIKQAQLVISHDTGMMHIASAFNKKIISVWGNTVPEFGMYPYMPQHHQSSYITEVKNLPCRPCSKIGKTSCPKGHFKCMNDIDLHAILQQALVYTS
jgi:ADP-heptose:LPS heptosyltransferase